ncbi:hypothetical protein CDD83_6523 [Cordyceps sp. RAO-2017]|nr:hypothetical protein CDD83_6523 [Cordyceps sp. RAO-2017]
MPQRYLRGLASVAAAAAADDVAVVLVSFMRSGDFWREGAAKMGLDLGVLARAGRFVFVDGLTGLFAPALGRTGGAPPGADRVIFGSELGTVRRGIEAGLAAAHGAKTVLIVDQIDVLVAAAAPADNVTDLSVQSMLLSLRETPSQRAHATILTFAADDPLLQAQTTTLERRHAALVLSQTHAARTIVSLRKLDTGTARDVSGVMRITAAAHDDGHDDGDDGLRDDAEYLYHVGGDLSVRVFERGA